MQNLISGYQELSDSLTAIANAHPDQTALVQAINGLNVQIQQAIDQQTQIKNKLDEIAAALPSATADASTLKKELDDLLARGTASVNSVKTSYEQNVKSSLDGLATNLDSTNSSLVNLLGQVDNSVQQISSVTGSASTDLSTVKESLEQTVSLLNESSEKLQKVSTTLSTDGSDGVQMLENILAEDPQTIGAFLAAPVSLNETKIYPIENYGTAMAPFYSTLAIWVGAVVMAAMLKVNVSESVVKKLSGAKPHQLYFGRLLLFVCIGLLQSGLICLGDLYFLGIQCEHPFLFLVTGWFTSFVYVNLIYALTVSFGDIGKAIQRYAHINGYSVVEEFCGHGIGMTMHEDPYVFHFKTKEDTVLIVPGMVFTIEPMLNQGTRHVHLNYNDDWTVYTDDGKLSAQWEHTFLVTEDGVEIISK